MSLLLDGFEKCSMLTKTGKRPDGEGGFIYDVWEEGEQFDAAFDYQASMQAKVAEKQGVTGLWNILVKRSTHLEFHNVFKRLSDGQTFRVTSKDDKKTPEGAGLDLRLVAAEEWIPE